MLLSTWYLSQALTCQLATPFTTAKSGLTVWSTLTVSVVPVPSEGFKCLRDNERKIIVIKKWVLAAEITCDPFRPLKCSLLKFRYFTPHGWLPPYETAFPDMKTYPIFIILPSITFLLFKTGKYTLFILTFVHNQPVGCVTKLYLQRPFRNNIIRSSASSTWCPPQKDIMRAC